MGTLSNWAVGFVVAALLLGCEGTSRRDDASGATDAGESGAGGRTNSGGSSSGTPNAGGANVGGAGSGGAAGSTAGGGQNSGGSSAASGSGGDAGSDGGSAGTGDMPPNDDCFRLCDTTNFDCTLSDPPSQGSATISRAETYGCSGSLNLAGEAPELWLHCDTGIICVEHADECLPSTFDETSFGYLIPDKGTTVRCVRR